MRRKLAGAFAAVVLTVTMSGCSLGGNEPEPVTPTETVTESVTSEPQPTPEPETTEPEVPEEDIDQLYVDVLRDEYPLFNDVPDSVLVDFAETTCQAFDEGASLQEILGVIQDNAQTRQEAEAFAFAAGAAVPAYCPEHSDKIPGLDNGSTA